MKTIFEGTVNGKVFNNVSDYNKALTEAIAAGGSVTANSKTYSAEEEVKPKTNFIGVVNGIEFNNVNDYNEAVKTCLEKGLTLNAHSSTTTDNMTGDCEEGQCCCEEDQCCCKDETNFFYGLEEDEQFYLDSITGTEEDEEILESWSDGLKENKEEVFAAIKNFDSQSLEDYSNDLTDTIKELEQDTKDILQVEETLYTDIEKYEKMIAEYEAKIAELTSLITKKYDSLAVIDNCKVLNNMFITHYSDVLAKVEQEMQPEPEPCETVNEANDNCENCNGVEPKELTDDDIRNAGREVIRKLIKNLFPTI